MIVPVTLISIPGMAVRAMVMAVKAMIKSVAVTPLGHTPLYEHIKFNNFKLKTVTYMNIMSSISFD